MYAPPKKTYEVTKEGAEAWLQEVKEKITDRGYYCWKNLDLLIVESVQVSQKMDGSVDIALVPKCSKKQGWPSVIRALGNLSWAIRFSYPYPVVPEYTEISDKNEKIVVTIPKAMYPAVMLAPSTPPPPVSQGTSSSTTPPSTPVTLLGTALLPLRGWSHYKLLVSSSSPATSTPTPTPLEDVKAWLRSFFKNNGQFLHDHVKIPKETGLPLSPVFDFANELFIKYFVGRIESCKEFNESWYRQYEIVFKFKDNTLERLILDVLCEATLSCYPELKPHCGHGPQEGLAIYLSAYRIHSCVRSTSPAISASSVSSPSSSTSTPTPTPLEDVKTWLRSFFTSHDKYLRDRVEIPEETGLPLSPVSPVFDFAHERFIEYFVGKIESCEYMDNQYEIVFKFRDNTLERRILDVLFYVTNAPYPKFKAHCGNDQQEGLVISLSADMIRSCVRATSPTLSVPLASSSSSTTTSTPVPPALPSSTPISSAPTASSLTSTSSPSRGEGVFTPPKGSPGSRTEMTTFVSTASSSTSSSTSLPSVFFRSPVTQGASSSTTSPSTQASLTTPSGTLVTSAPPAPSSSSTSTPSLSSTGRGLFTSPKDQPGNKEKWTEMTAIPKRTS
ncbi:MAG: hypothetical protein WCW01_06495 [Gammaproteobacteria bacterium]